MNKRKEHPLLSWAAAPMMLLAYLLLLAPQWGAEPGAGLGSHLRYSLSYGLHMPTALVLPVLLAAVLQGVLLWLLTQEQGRPQLPELLLAAFFTQNILIGMTEDRRLNFLLAYPGLSVVENILVWAGLLLSCAIGIR